MTTSYATDVSPIVMDIETCDLETAADYLSPVSAARNLKDPAKIAADIEQRTADRDSKIALDWNVGRIAAMGWWTEADGPIVRLCSTEDQERQAIGGFWHVAKHRTIVGFNIKGFDLRYLIQRSRLLGVPHPMLDLGKYAKSGIEDLFLLLTFGDGTYDQGAMKRTLRAFATRFGIPVTDPIEGADVPGLVKAGAWDQVADHVRADVTLTLALAQRLGVIRQSAPTSALMGV